MMNNSNIRPIDANALNAKFEQLKAHPDNNIQDIVFLDGAMSVVDAAHTLDYAPVRHGKWVPGEAKCQVCKKDKFDDLDADIWSDWQPAYCPNCGTKMDKEKENA